MQATNKACKALDCVSLPVAGSVLPYWYFDCSFLICYFFFETNFSQESLDFFWLIISFTKPIAAAGNCSCCFDKPAFHSFFLSLKVILLPICNKCGKIPTFPPMLRQAIKLWYFFPGIWSLFITNHSIFLQFLAINKTVLWRDDSHDKLWSPFSSSYCVHKHVGRSFFHLSAAEEHATSVLAPTEVAQARQASALTDLW